MNLMVRNIQYIICKSRYLWSIDFTSHRVAVLFVPHIDDDAHIASNQNLDPLCHQDGIRAEFQPGQTGSRSRQIVRRTRQQPRDRP